ncbi:MAG: sugar O-acetyltransferase [Mobilicoccus sp.]|nr:sugar O-acetyltransferase [Mobilicoccus sp.]
MTDDDRSMMDVLRSGERYLADHPELTAAHGRAMALQEQYNATTHTETDRRRQLLEDLLGEVGENVTVRPPLFVDYGVNISIGEGTFVNNGLVALDCARITIGRDVQIATNVQLLPPMHPLEAQPRRDKWEWAEPITIGDNVWLGGGVIVCPGVTIGESTVVGAGSVVTKDLPANVLAVGNPARVIRELD